MPKLHPQAPPPADYYADNLSFVVEHVVKQYWDILNAREAEIASSILKLSPDGRRLFARLAMRKVEVFRNDKVRYSEVSNWNKAFIEIEDAKLVVSEPEIDSCQLLSLPTVPELRALFDRFKMNGRKQDCVELISATCGLDCIKNRIRQHFSWFQLGVREELRLFSLLFFGNLVDDFSKFVLRDLGLFVFEKYQLDHKTRLFPDRECVVTYLRIAQAKETVETLGKEIEISVALILIEDFRDVHSHPLLERRRSKLLNALGRNLERVGAFAEAQGVYSHSTLPPSRERIARIFSRQGESDECLRVLNLIRTSPWSTEELEFADTFGKRKSRNNDVRIEVRLLGKPVEDSIEQYTIRELEKTGYSAWHFENRFPLALFGLAYWDWIFAPSDGAFVNAFQVAPIDLFLPGFFDSRSHISADPLDFIRSLKNLILNTVDRKAGISNVLVDWDVCTSDAFRKCVTALSAVELRGLLEILGRDLSQMKSGFPDLTVINSNGRVEFIEVKGPTDQLQRNQVIWMRALASADISAKVIRYVQS